MNADQLLELIKIVIWPIVFLVFYASNFKSFKSIIKSLTNRIKSGAAFEIKGIKVGEIPIDLPIPDGSEDVTEKHLALIHSSWRYSRKDNEFNKKMYCFQVIVQGQESVLDRIEYVKYKLNPTYPNSDQIKHDRNKYFELKELAWGASTIKAEVKIKNQEKIIKLSRFINLAETGENLLKKY